MTDKIKRRIASIYEMVNRGETEGERSAAKAALDRLVSRYNLNLSELENIGEKRHEFRYATDLEHWLLASLIAFFFDQEVRQTAQRHTYNPKALKRCKMITVILSYQDYITLDCAYEYFRRHMKIQWKKTCALVIAKCRKRKTRNKKRSQLQNAFFDQYAIASGLVDPETVSPIDLNSLSKEEYVNLMTLHGLEGGKYREQMTSGLLLEESNY